MNCRWRGRGQGRGVATQVKSIDSRPPQLASGAGSTHSIGLTLARQMVASVFIMREDLTFCDF